MGSKSDPPPAPDYVGAAHAQGAANVDAARASAKLSNPSFSNPFGSRTVNFGWNGDPDSVYVTDSLSPIGQQRFDQNQRIDTGLGNLAETGLGFVQNTLNSPFNQGALPAAPGADDATRQRVEDAMYARATARLDPRFDRQESQLENRLINQGLTRGSEAFGNAMQEFNFAKNDAYDNAMNQAIAAGGAEQSRLYGMGTDARSRAIQEQEFFRTEPLNILNAVRSAAPVGMPQFQSYSGSNVAPAPIFRGAVEQGEAGMNAYNQQQMQDAMFMQGLMSLGSSAMPFFL